MKLTTKWLLWFTGIGIYVMALGGVFYYNLFKWTFDEKLKIDIIDTVKVYAQSLREGLVDNSKSISFKEFNIMTETLSKDERIASIIYMNKVGVIRWHRESRFIGVPYDEFSKNVPPLTDAIVQALNSLKPKVRPVPKQPFYEIAIPLTVGGDLVGILDLIVSKASADILISSAMQKYVIGALGVLFLLGLPLLFFFHHYVTSPLELLSEAMGSMSFKTFELRFPQRSDEIGVLANSISDFMIRVKAEVENINKKTLVNKDSQEKWWRTIIKMLIKQNEYVIVVNENNNILYANFDLNTEEKNIHLLDVVDNQQQNLLRMIGNSFDSPEEIISGETIFKGVQMNVRVVHIGNQQEENKTLIFFLPKN